MIDIILNKRCLDEMRQYSGNSLRKPLLTDAQSGFREGQGTLYQKRAIGREVGTSCRAMCMRLSTVYDSVHREA